MGKDSFYSAYGDWTDKLVEGGSLKLEHTVEYEQFRVDIPEIAEAVTKTVPELKQQRKDSAKLEQDIFRRIQAVVKEWEAQAGQTLLLDKALEYINTPQVAHTDNQWKRREDGSWVISNLVYKMSYKIWEDPGGEKKGTWLVSWTLEINCPKRPATEKYAFCGESTVAEQRKKRYDTFDAAQRYIQGRFDLYANCFSELRPPVPAKFKRHFYINGCLLPHYTVAPPEQTAPDHAAVEALLKFAGADDAPLSTPAAGPAPEAQAPTPTADPAPEQHTSTPAAGRKPARPAAGPNRKKSKAARGGTAR